MTKRVTLRETLIRQSNWLVGSEVLGLITLIGWFDYQTGWEWSFFAPFALPIILATWKAGPRWGCASATLCALVFWAANTDSHPYQTGWGFPLAVFGRWFYFLILVVAIYAIKTIRNLDRERIRTLEHAQKLERQILDTSEREQQRISRDLHDSLGPHLAAVGYEASNLARELHPHHPSGEKSAAKICHLVAEAVSLTRDLARGISPVLLDASGLSVALEGLARTTSGLGVAKVTFHETGDTNIGNPEDSIQLYRICQEALNNALKHGRAKNVTILLGRKAQAFRLTVADDGVGFTALPGNKQGMGMHSMQYRARALGGELKIDSHPGEGTVVSCEIPGQRLPKDPNRS